MQTGHQITLELVLIPDKGPLLEMLKSCLLPGSESIFDTFTLPKACSSLGELVNANIKCSDVIAW